MTKALKTEKEGTEESGGIAVGCFQQLGLIQVEGGERIQLWDSQSGTETAANVWAKMRYALMSPLQSAGFRVNAHWAVRYQATLSALFTASILLPSQVDRKAFSPFDPATCFLQRGRESDLQRILLLLLLAANQCHPNQPGRRLPRSQRLWSGDAGASKAGRKAKERGSAPPHAPWGRSCRLLIATGSQLLWGSQ